jgi:hypothetical protein
MSIETVPQGQEGIELSARLEETGGIIQVPVHWLLRNELGETVVDRNEPVAAATLAPGQYQAEVRYGAVRVSRAVTLPEASFVRLNFILDAGGVRVLPRLKGLASSTLPSVSRIFALDGPHAGKLVATSATAGEVLRVPAGTYRVESRFINGNAEASTEVRVKAGMMSAVEFDHIAGIAQLSAPVTAEDAIWTVKDSRGIEVVASEGEVAAVALRPGNYVAAVIAVGKTYSKSFSIGAGERREILLEK